MIQKIFAGFGAIASHLNFVVIRFAGTGLTPAFLINFFDDISTWSKIPENIMTRFLLAAGGVFTMYPVNGPWARTIRRGFAVFEGKADYPTIEGILSASLVFVAGDITVIEVAEVVAFRILAGGEINWQRRENLGPTGRRFLG